MTKIKKEMENEIASVICNKESNISCEQCFTNGGKDICRGFRQCRVSEKTEEQLRYVLSSIENNLFLKACAGSGKTEVVGMKAAFEINKWDKKASSGIAVLTFTNEATEVIKNRIIQFNNMTATYPHFVGTFSSFVHQYIAQPFGYKYIGNYSETDDYSFKIVQKDLSVNSNPWLKNFKCKIGLTPKNKYNSIPIYSHQIYKDLKTNGYLIPNGKDQYITFEKHYNSEIYQSELKKKREELNNPWYHKYKYCLDELKKDKQSFLKQGFANFEDMNNIAFFVLSKSQKICEIISKKFPLIIVDECQDLSWIELQILKKLMIEGSILHLIGDLNQSIFEFKRVDLKDTENFIEEFQKFELNINFRSCDSIVKFTNGLVPGCKDVVSACENKYQDYALLYLIFENGKERDVIERYIKILEKLGISQENACIIAKQNKMVEKLLDTDGGSSPLIVALQLWNGGNPRQKEKALEYTGAVVSKWFGGGRTKSNYYCPKDITSVFKWRIFLKNILNDFCEIKDLQNFTRKYKEWHKDARKIIPDIIKKRYIDIKDFDEATRDFNEIFSGKWFDSPREQADKEIEILNNKDIHFKIPVKTIHESKGCTYESTMVVSSIDKKSEYGHWKAHWLDGNEEAKRIGYVASTRAKYLLVWAIPTPTTKDIKVLESRGFKNAELL